MSFHLNLDRWNTHIVGVSSWITRSTRIISLSIVRDTRYRYNRVVCNDLSLVLPEVVRPCWAGGSAHVPPASDTQSRLTNVLPLCRQNKHVINFISRWFVLRLKLNLHKYDSSSKSDFIKITWSELLLSLEVISGNLRLTIATLNMKIN